MPALGMTVSRVWVNAPESERCNVCPAAFLPCWTNAGKWRWAVFNQEDRGLSWRVWGWRTVFNNEKERHHLKALLDGIHPEHEEKNLRSIIETSNTNDWRDYFSSTHETFRFCTDKRIRQHWEQKNRFDLLYKARITEKDGYFAELRSYVLYHNLKNNSYFAAQNIAIDYKRGRQNDRATHIILKKPEEENLFICYDYAQNQFRCFYDSEYKKETENQYQNTLINIEKNMEYLCDLLFNLIPS